MSGERTTNHETVDAFNAACPIGTPVLAFPGSRDGRALMTTTRSTAWLVGVEPVVMVEGYAGGIALTHVEVLPSESAPDPTAGERTIRVQVTVDTDELRRWADKHADAGNHGVAHVLYKAASDGESLTEQSIREARADEQKAAWDWFGEMLKAHQYEGQPIWDEYQSDRRSLLARDGGR